MGVLCPCNDFSSSNSEEIVYWLIREPQPMSPNPQRPYAKHLAELKVKIWSDLHGDMQSQAEMSWPPAIWPVVTEMSVPIRCSRRRFEKGCP